MAVCKYCGEPIEWTRNLNGSWIPLVPESNEPHAAVCNKPPMFRAEAEILEKKVNRNPVVTVPRKDGRGYRVIIGKAAKKIIAGFGKKPYSEIPPWD